MRIIWLFKEKNIYARAPSYNSELDRHRVFLFVRLESTPGEVCLWSECGELRVLRISSLKIWALPGLLGKTLFLWGEKEEWSSVGRPWVHFPVLCGQKKDKGSRLEKSEVFMRLLYVQHLFLSLKAMHITGLARAGTSFPFGSPSLQSHNLLVHADCDWGQQAVCGNRRLE